MRRSGIYPCVQRGEGTKENLSPCCSVDDINRLRSIHGVWIRVNGHWRRVGSVNPRELFPARVAAKPTVSRRSADLDERIQQGKAERRVRAVSHCWRA